MHLKSNLFYQVLNSQKNLVSFSYQTNMAYLIFKSDMSDLGSPYEELCISVNGIFSPDFQLNAVSINL